MLGNESFSDSEKDSITEDLCFEELNDLWKNAYQEFVCGQTVWAANPAEHNLIAVHIIQSWMKLQELYCREDRRSSVAKEWYKEMIRHPDFPSGALQCADIFQREMPWIIADHQHDCAENNDGCENSVEWAWHILILEQTLNHCRQRLQEKFFPHKCRRSKLLFRLFSLVLVICWLGLWYYPRSTEYRVLRSRQGWGGLKYDLSVERNSLSVGGVRYESGFGTHADSSIVLQLSKDFQIFSGAVGVDDETRGRGSVLFKIYAKDQLLWSSSVMRGGDRAQQFRISVGGISLVDLIVEDAGDGKYSDHADWLDLRFEE